MLGYAGPSGFFHAGMFAYIDYHHLPARLCDPLFAGGIIGIMSKG